MVTKQMVANKEKAKPALAEVPHDPKPPKERSHEGETERTLNYRDRDLIVQAARAYIKEGDNSDAMGMHRLRQVEKILKLEECSEYFNMCAESDQETHLKHAEQMGDWARWNSWKIDPKRQEKDRPPEAKKPEKPKDTKPEDLRGRARKFWLPSKLDSWIKDVLKAMKWKNPLMAEFVDELNEKYGFKFED